MIDDKYLLFIEPSAQVSEGPIVDELTMKMAGALRQAVAGAAHGSNFSAGFGYRGYHSCACGATSSSCDYQLPGGEITNSLATHYLTWHRAEVSQQQLDRVAALAVDPVELTPQELKCR